MFQGNDLEELRLAFIIVDDVYALRKKVFEKCSLNDRLDDVSVVVPNYEKNATIMRCDLRETGYLEEPYEKKTLLSIDGEPLHEDLNSLFRLSQERREADILNAYRFNDFTNLRNVQKKISKMKY